MIRAIPRAGRNSHVILSAPSSGLRNARDGLAPGTQVAEASSEGKQALYVLYGSNTGSCESFAQKIATAAPSYGMSCFPPCIVRC
jgi:cytochrome P450/NADPH-cytochrome P450 reductase